MAEREIFIKDTHRGLRYEDGVLVKVSAPAALNCPGPNFPKLRRLLASSASPRSKLSSSICAAET